MLFIITGEVDERIIANLMGFLEATESMDKFKTDDLELTALNDGNQATVTIPLTHQEMIDDLIDLLVSKLLLQVLYLYKPTRPATTSTPSPTPCPIRTKCMWYA